MTKKSIFFEVQCLTEMSRPFNAPDIHKKWFSGDRRILGVTLQKLIDYNRESFRFLGVTPMLLGSENSLSLYFRSDKHIGAIPIRSPETGKPMGDFLVYPRFGSSNDRFKEYTELIKIVGLGIQPEINYALELNSTIDYSFPQYYEAVKYINLLCELIKKPWQKFREERTTAAYFKGNVDWERHILKSYDVERMKIPTSFSQMSEDHNDYRSIKYAFRVAQKQIFNSGTPVAIKNSIHEAVTQIETRLCKINERETNELKIYSSDFSIVKQAKHQANIVLKANSFLKRAWRIDYSLVFERYTQFLFGQIGKEIGGQVLNNYAIENRSNFGNKWSLRYLEPDIAFEKDGNTIFIDAKYKSHLFNWGSDSVILKDEHRKDIHQILAYSSFDKATRKLMFLCYPDSRYKESCEEFFNDRNKTTAYIYLLGLPLEKASIAVVKEKIKNIISNNLDKQ